MVGTILGAQVTDIGSEQMESTGKHTEQGRHHDADKRRCYRRIHAAMLVDLTHGSNVKSMKIA